MDQYKFIFTTKLLIIIGLLSFVFGSQTNSQGYLTNVKVIDEALADGYGILSVSVSEYGASPIPIIGATVTVWGYDTIYICTTGPDSVCCWELPTGTYTVCAEADGFVEECVADVYVGDEQTMDLDFQLFEFPYPALGVWAERNT